MKRIGLSFFTLFTLGFTPCGYISSLDWGKQKLSSFERLPASSSDLYTQDIRSERESQYVEVFLSLNIPKNSNFNDRIFTQDLSRDFKTQYRERFQTPRDRPEITQQEMYTAYNSRVVLDSDKRKEFAEYMIKRLTEFHVDNYVKQDPTMRPIYDAKEKLQNVEVRMGQQTKVNLKYSLAGNMLDVIVESPYMDEAKVTLLMDPRAFGPTNPNNTQVFLGKNLDKKRQLQFIYDEDLAQFGSYLAHAIGPQVSGYYGISSSNRESTIDPETNLVTQLDPIKASIGIGWRF